MRFRVLLAAVCVALLAAGAASVAVAATPLPAHVYAPYFETWTSDSITTVAQQSGSRYFTLAFLETLSKSSCTLGWDGSKVDSIPNGKYLSDIASLRATGGDVIPRSAAGAPTRAARRSATPARTRTRSPRRMSS